MWSWRWRCGSRRRRAKCFRRKAVARFVCYTTRCDFIFRWRRGQPATDNRCRSATIAVRRPRVTAPAAARVGRARALPVWRAAAPAARRAAGGSRRTPPAAWVSTLRNLKRWRAPTPDGGTTAPHGDMAAQAVSFSLVRGLDPGATQSPGVQSCAATKRPPSNPRHATRRRPRRRADRSAERPPCPWPSRRTRQGRWIVCSVSLGDVLTKHHEKSSSHEKRNR